MLNEEEDLSKPEINQADAAFTENGCFRSTFDFTPPSTYWQSFLVIRVLDVGGFDEKSPTM